MPEMSAKKAKNILGLLAFQIMPSDIDNLSICKQFIKKYTSSVEI